VRSLLVPFLLCLGALLSVGIAALRVSESGLGRLLGAPPTPIGAPLYQFDPASVHEISLAGNGFSTYSVKTPLGWETVSPWRDRMDPRVVQALLQFTLGGRVEGAIPVDKLETTSLGFEDGRIGVRLADVDGEPLAKFIVGPNTAWFATDPDSGEMIPTRFIEPRDRSRKDFVYAATDPLDLPSRLGERLSRVRDHHPFLFHPNQIESIRIRNEAGEMLLSRAAPGQLWSIVKPLELDSDPEALKRLVQGLYDLEALRVMSRSEVTLPADDPENFDLIALSLFGFEEEIALKLFPPASPDAPTRLASVSDRPDAVFELTVQPPTDPERHPGLANLPLSVNELRDPTLTSIDIRAVQAIRVSPALGEDLLIRRERPEQRFQVRLAGVEQEPNETALFSLLKTLTEMPVEAFVSDTVIEPANYGLDRPFLTLRFLAFDSTSIQIDFGESEDGSIHAMRSDGTSVVEVDPAMLELIPTEPWEWRNARVWTVSKPDVEGIRRLQPDEPPLELGYADEIERWTARVGGEERGDLLARDRANRWLEALVGLEADHWLRPGHDGAREALLQPSLTIELLAKTYDARGELAGTRVRSLKFAPAGETGRLHYGLLEGDPNPFLVDRATYQRLAADLFELE